MKTSYTYEIASTCLAFDVLPVTSLSVVGKLGV